MKKPSRPFPLRFLIKGSLWRVKFKKNLVDDDGDTCTGLTDTENCIINIDASLTGKDLEWVFWHEYQHAVLDEIGVTGNTGGLSDLVEEQICDAFADSLTRDKKVKWKRIKRVKL